MADVTITSGYPKTIGSLGANTLYLWKLTDIDDGETLATGLGARILAFWVQPQTDPSTNTSAGINAVNASGTITFYPGVDNMAADVLVLASGV